MLPNAAQIAERLLSPVSTQGLLALTATQVSGFIVFLILFQYLYKEVKARFLRLWIVGWVLLTASATARLVAEVFWQNIAERAAIEALSFAALCYVLASCLEYSKPGRSLNAIWTAGVIGTIGTAAIASWGAGAPAWAAATPPALGGFVLVASSLALWRTRESLKSHGVALLSFSLFLAGLHHMGQPMWTLDQVSWLRVSSADLIQIPIGLGMAVVVLEAARRRVEDLNDKLRRLTLITAASAQSQKVDDVLQTALQDLVTNLNVTHGIVRMVGRGADSDVLRTCANVGFSDEYRNTPLSAKEPWVRGLLDQSLTCVSLGRIRRLNFASKWPSRISRRLFPSLCRVRNAPVGLLTIGSSRPHEFQPDEISFVVGVGNLLGLTVQNLNWVEHVGNAEKQWSNTFDSIADPILVHDSAGNNSAQISRWLRD